MGYGTDAQCVPDVFASAEASESMRSRGLKLTVLTDVAALHSTGSP